MSEDVQKRLDLLEMALGIESSDRDSCPETPGSECEVCQLETCPLVNNLLQATATQTEHLGHRVRRLEIWLEQVFGTDYRERASLLEQREGLLTDIQDVETALSRARGQEVSADLLSFLARQKARLEKIDTLLEKLQNER